MIFEKDSSKMLLIAGPCSLESRDLSFEVADEVARIASKYADWLVAVFKGSFDKANRTSIKSPRGPGMEKGLEILSEVREKFGLPVITDVHESYQCAEVAKVCDALQIPAFLCRQTDLLVAAAKTGKAVNVKKGQFLSPYDMKYVVSKLREAGASEIWQAERGSTFGYGNLVVDMRSIAIMAERNTGDYRRNPLSAAARKGRRSERGRAQICRADSAGGNRGGRGRSVSRNTPNP